MFTFQSDILISPKSLKTFLECKADKTLADRDLTSFKEDVYTIQRNKNVFNNYRFSKTNVQREGNLFSNL